MKNLKKYWLYLLIIILLFSCNKNANNEKEQMAQDSIVNTVAITSSSQNIVNGNNTNSAVFTFSQLVNEKHDYFTDYYWGLSDGRYLEDQSIQTIDWIGPMTPRVIFHKLDIPTGSVLYQVRLRNDLFYFLYQTETEEKKLYTIGTTFGSEPFDVEFRDNYSRLIRNRNNYIFSAGNRVGEQINNKYPLVGIWGSLPSLTEYRLIDPADCLYYMEIDKEIPDWAVRSGTYLLKQTGENVLETISSFPDGWLKLEIIDERQILLRPLFTLPDDEEGIVGLLTMHRNPIKTSEITEEYPYNH
ncbi:MAG: hypothetical protein FWD13_01300 [Treponema sp.]|nr:hypothetical protein [Treponema sp.]